MKYNWDERYRSGEHTNDAPHPLVVRFCGTLPPGRALDLACGAGRHAIWLARRGWQVTAVDSSAVAIDILEDRASQGGVTVKTRVANLERHEFLIEPASYDFTVLCNYLQRDLFPSIKQGTRLGGTVIAIIAMIDDDPAIKPMNPAFLLNPGELRKHFANDWTILHDFEGKPAGDGPRRSAAEIVARRSR